VKEAVREDAQRHAALVRAFRLIYEIQAAMPGAVDELAELAGSAVRLGWDEVVRAALFGEVVTAWFTGKGDQSAAIAALMARSVRDEDPTMLALALAVRADRTVANDDPTAVATAEDDLAKAVVLLELGRGGPLERISGHTACGMALVNRWQFELGEEQYRTALEIGRNEAPGTVDFLLAPVAFNLAEAQVSWACVLRQLGDTAAVSARLRAWKAALRQAAAFQMPEIWRAELGALGLLLAAVARRDSAAEARRRLKHLSGADAEGSRAARLLRLAAALADHDAARPGAGVALETALSGIDPTLHPQAYDLALLMQAQSESSGGAQSALRYARRHATLHWATRLAAQAAMRARISAERLASEHQVLSQHVRLDDLTGIGNRRALEQYLIELEQRSVGTVALMMADLNSFKAVNDRYGHLAGDAVLVAIARILQANIRDSDLAVRLGGDEFAVVLAGVSEQNAFARVAEILRKLGRRSFDDVIPGLKVSLSAGIAVGAPGRFADIRARADAALYRAKAGGGRRLTNSRLVGP
jgi:diguanylate cyclase (GGDEF)-like protein